MSEPTKFGKPGGARFWRLCKKCASQTPQDWVFLFRAFLALGRARLLMLTSTDSDLVSSLQHANPNLRNDVLGPADRIWIRRTGEALKNASAVVLWRSDCLVQAIAADHLLRRRGLQPSFYLGVQVGSETDFSAHCWLDCCGDPVVGKTQETFSVLVPPSPECPLGSTSLPS